jgi:hypothetical protein
MKHPAEAELALFSGGDLGFWERRRVGRHVARCPECRDTIDAFHATRDRIQDLAGELPKDLNWNRLAGEMTGNIRVGLAAGEAIARFDRPALKPRRLGWHAATVLAGASIICAAAFWVNLPQPQAAFITSFLHRIRAERIGTVVVGHRPVVVTPDDVVLEASRSSIQVRENGGSMSMMHPHSDGVTISVNMQGSAGARYVDADTGQVTINRVYYAQQ